MTPEQAREVEHLHAAVHAAAAYWQSRASVNGNAEVGAAEVASRSTGEDLSTTQAAALLGVSERRVCQLAADWQHDGLARKVGHSWLVDREAVGGLLEEGLMSRAEDTAGRDLERHALRLALAPVFQ